MIELDVTSRAFKDSGSIPRKYTCDGDNVNPPLTVKSVPKNAKTMALIVDDPDAPGMTWTHWVVWNIPASETVEIEEDSVPGTEGENDSGRNAYGGPCPPSGTHRYFFRVFALDSELGLEEGTSRRVVEDEIEKHKVADGVLMGRYSRS